MKKEVKEVRNITIERCFCDICGKKMNRPRVCAGCGRDICNDCIGHIDDDLGDYPNYYCTECWEKKKQRKQIVEDFCIKISKQEDTPQEFIEIVNDKFWEMI